jgi:osmotically-inducible protein OsmY
MAVRSLTGVKGVTNLLAIKPKAASVNVKGEIRAALDRHAFLDSQKIQVEADGGGVVLRGLARSFYEREEAERAAWAASGVSWVDNQLKVN